MGKIFKKIRDRAEDGLRGMCGRMTPDKRVITIAVLMVVFAAVDIWVTFRAIYNIGRDDREVERIEITPLEVPDFRLDDEEPTDLQKGIEEYFKQNFKTEENDTTSTEQEQTDF